MNVIDILCALSGSMLILSFFVAIMCGLPILMAGAVM